MGWAVALNQVSRQSTWYGFCFRRRGGYINPMTNVNTSKSSTMHVNPLLPSIVTYHNIVFTDDQRRQHCYDRETTDVTQKDIECSQCHRDVREQKDMCLHSCCHVLCWECEKKAVAAVVSVGAPLQCPLCSTRWRFGIYDECKLDALGDALKKDDDDGWFDDNTNGDGDGDGDCSGRNFRYNLLQDISVFQDDDPEMYAILQNWYS